MNSATFAKIRQEHDMTVEDVDRAIGVVIALMDAEIEELGKERFACNEIEALDKAADEVANLLGRLEM